MATNNPVKRPRQIFVTANKYQKEIIFLAFVPSTLIFLSFATIVFICNPDVSKALFHVSFYDKINVVKQFSMLIVFLMCLCFFLSLVAAFIISHNMVGAFGRITRELDEIIAGRSQRVISSRPHDTLSKDLLKRINVLVEFYIKHEKKNS